MADAKGAALTTASKEALGRAACSMLSGRSNPRILHGKAFEAAKDAASEVAKAAAVSQATAGVKAWAPASQCHSLFQVVLAFRDFS